MPRAKKEETPAVTEQPAPTVLPLDSAVAVYRDRAGKSLGGGLSEGKSNFAAVTEAARSVLTTAK